MATQVQDDLAKIKANIDTQLQALRKQAGIHQVKIAELSARLVDVQDRKHQYETTTQEAQTYLDRGRLALFEKQDTLKHAKGTSVEASVVESLQVVQAYMANHQKVYTDVSELLAGATQEEAGIMRQIADAEAALAEVVTNFNKADSQLHTFNTQHANEARRVALFRLFHANEALAGAKSQVEMAQAKRAEAQDMLARDLAEWPGLAHDTLLEYGIFPVNGAEEVLLLKRKLIELLEDNRQHIGPVAAALVEKAIPVKTIIDFGGTKEHNAILARQKAAGNVSVILNPVIAHLEMHMADLDRVIAEIHQKHQEVEVQALVKSKQG